jgi:CBS-domain-containing membrane protein
MAEFPSLASGKPERMTTMQVKDIMSRNVIWVGTEDSVLRAARLMLQNHISGLPVIDMNGKLAGIVTEGDFLRRGEIGTERHRPRWLEFLVGPGKLAEEYAHASGRKIEEIMRQTLIPSVKPIRLKRSSS